MNGRAPDDASTQNGKNKYQLLTVGVALPLLRSERHH